MIGEREFLVFCITIFPEQAQNKNKVGIKTTFLLMMEKHEAKSPTQVHFRLRRDERIFLKHMKQQTNALFELTSSRENIKSNPIVAKHSDSSLGRSRGCLQLNLELYFSKRNSAQHRDQVPLDESHMRDRL